MHLWLPFCILHSSCVQYICLHLQICIVHRCKVFQSRNLKKSELHSVLICRIGFYRFLYYLQCGLSLLVLWIFWLGLLYLFLTSDNTPSSLIPFSPSHVHRKNAWLSLFLFWLQEQLKDACLVYLLYSASWQGTVQSTFGSHSELYL